MAGRYGGEFGPVSRAVGFSAIDTTATAIQEAKRTKALTPDLMAEAVVTYARRLAAGDKTVFVIRIDEKGYSSDIQLFWDLNSQTNRSRQIIASWSHFGSALSTSRETGFESVQNYEAGASVLPEILRDDIETVASLAEHKIDRRNENILQAPEDAMRLTYTVLFSASERRV